MVGIFLYCICGLEKNSVGTKSVLIISNIVYGAWVEELLT